MRYFALIFLATLFLVPLESAALDQQICVLNSTSENTTGHAVWADVSWSYKGQKWHIDKAFYLSPRTGRNTAFIRYNHLRLGPQVRFRFYAKDRSDCGGRTLTWSQNAQNIRMRAPSTYHVAYRSTYREQNGHYSIDTRLEY